MDEWADNGCVVLDRFLLDSFVSFCSHTSISITDKHPWRDEPAGYLVRYCTTMVSFTSFRAARVFFYSKDYSTRSVGLIMGRMAQ
jgi:hypothetical protein